MNQKKKHKGLHLISIICFFAMLFVAGCGDKNKSGMTESELERIAIAQKIKLVEASGGLVLMVGGETISSNEIINSPIQFEQKFVSPLEYFGSAAEAKTLTQFKESARPEMKVIVSNRISEILLYLEAKKQAGTDIDESLEKAAQTELRMFILSFGGDEAKADQALKKRGLDRKSFKERKKKEILLRSFMSSKFPRYQPPTYRELLDYYEKVKDKFFAKPGKIQFRLIDIEIAKVELKDPNQSRLEEGKKLASELLNRVRAGEDFAALAKQFSNDYRRELGSLWGPLQPESLASPYDVLSKEAGKIQPGEVAGPIETPEHIFIMRLEEKQSAGYEPFEKVQGQIEDRIFEEHRNEVINKLNARLLEQTELSLTDEFVDFCLGKIYEMARQ